MDIRNWYHNSGYTLSYMGTCDLVLKYKFWWTSSELNLTNQSWLLSVHFSKVLTKGNSPCDLSSVLITLSLFFLFTLIWSVLASILRFYIIFTQHISKVAVIHQLYHPGNSNQALKLILYENSLFMLLPWHILWKNQPDPMLESLSSY